MITNFTKTTSFSFRELRTLLFAKKICPTCKIRLKRIDKDNIVKEGWMKGVMDLPSSLNFHYGK
ncbi:MAG: hypothetical protein V2A72_00005, partial [Candidatus Omnitrophota bacterium]